MQDPFYEIPFSQFQLVQNTSALLLVLFTIYTQKEPVGEKGTL